MTLQSTDLFMVQRGDDLHKLTYANLLAKLQDDLAAVTQTNSMLIKQIEELESEITVLKAQNY